MDRTTQWSILWRIERRDGVTIALTDHDRDIVDDGLTHHAAPGMIPSAIVRSDRLDADTTEARGALTGAAITERDLLAGRWDGARVIVTAIDRSGATARVALGEGRIGGVDLADGGFTAELRGAAAAFDRPATEATSPECRATLGDRRCRVPMAARRRFARVVSSGDGGIVIDQDEPVANAYALGRLRWLGGPNAGLEAAVVRSAGRDVTLRDAAPFPVEPGTLIELTEGCDRTIATCAARFGNAANYRGEPYLPGIDLLTRYPGG